MGVYKRIVMHRRVVVNKLDGTAITGVLWDEVGPVIVLKGAQLLDPSQQDPIELDGEVIIERTTINFVQVLT